MARPLVLSFVGEENQGVLSWASRLMCDQFTARGYETAVINLKDAARGMATVRELVERHRFDFAFAFAGIGAGMNIGGQSAWDMMRVPFISLMADHPAYNPELHAVKSAYVGRIYRVRDFFDTQQRYLPAPGPSLCLPPQYQANPAPVEGAWCYRPYEIVYLKNGFDPAAIARQWGHCEAKLQSVLWDCIGYCETRTDVLIADVVARRIGLPPEALRETNVNFWVIVRLVDEYLRSQRMTRMASFLKTVPALIVGDGWDYLDKTDSKARFVPAIDAAQVPRLYTQAKLMVNTNPYFDHSVHERVLYALTAGCYAATDLNSFTRDHLLSAPGVIGFDWGDGGWQDSLRAAFDRALSAGAPPPFDGAALTGFDFGHDFAATIIGFADEIRAAGEASVTKNGTTTGRR